MYKLSKFEIWIYLKKDVVRDTYTIIITAIYLAMYLYSNKAKCKWNVEKKRTKKKIELRLI